MNTILILTAIYFCSMPFLLIWAACADAKEKGNDSVPPQIDLWN